MKPRWFEFWKKPRRLGPWMCWLGGGKGYQKRQVGLLNDAGGFACRWPKLVQFLGGLPALEFVVSPDRQWMAYTNDQ